MTSAGLAPAVTDGVRFLGEYTLDQNFLCAVVVCGYPGSVKTAVALQLAALTGAVVLKTGNVTSEFEAPTTLGARVGVDGCDADQYRASANPCLYLTPLTTGFRMARHRPVIIDAPCLGHVRAAAEKHIRLGDHLRQCTGEDVPVAAAWVDTDIVEPAHCRSFVGPAFRAALREQARHVVDIVICG